VLVSLLVKVILPVLSAAMPVILTALGRLMDTLDTSLTCPLASTLNFGISIEAPSLTVPGVLSPKLVNSS